MYQVLLCNLYTSHYFLHPCRRTTEVPIEASSDDEEEDEIHTRKATNINNKKKKQILPLLRFLCSNQKQFFQLLQLLQNPVKLMNSQL